MTVETVESAEVLAELIASKLCERLAEVQSQGRIPSVVLTGGTIAIDAYSRVAGNEVDWTSVDFYWGDERYVPAGHSDRNDQQARDAFLDRLGVPDERIHAMPAHGCGVSMAEAADSYAAQLPESPFDLVLLGMGPDGHIASLFPGFAQLDEAARQVVEVFGSPKPPPERITLTYPTLNNARSVWFLVTGEGKADPVARAIRGDAVASTPAAGVKGRQETLWLLDAAAASQL